MITLQKYICNRGGRWRWWCCDVGYDGGDGASIGDDAIGDGASGDGGFGGGVGGDGGCDIVLFW